VDAEVRRTTRRTDDPAVDDLLKEPEAVVPICSPAVGGQPKVVGHEERWLSDVDREVVTRRVALQCQTDANPLERLLKRLGGSLLLRAVGAVGHVRRETVRLSTSGQGRLGLIEVALVVGAV